MLRRVRTGVLEVAFEESGQADGWPVVLLHGFPYDIHAYDEVAPMLARAGARVIVPYLRGYGPTRFLFADTPRSGDPAYAEIERRLAQRPAIPVPTIWLEGAADGVTPLTRAPDFGRFSSRHELRTVKDAGHNLPQEKPQAFAEAVLAVRG